jgi:hypothetical protein
LRCAFRTNGRSSPDTVSRLREHCSDLDIHEGDVLRCRAENASQLILETTNGRTVALQRDWARFIEVVPDIPLPVQS